MTHTQLRHQGGMKPYVRLLILTALIFGSEMLIGVLAGSMALVSDATHTMSDVAAVGLAIWVEKGNGRRSDDAHHRAQIIARVGIGILILAAAAGIVIESVQRFSEPHAITAPIVAATATLCALLNRFQLMVLGNCQCHLDQDLRTHVKSDIWISVAVVVGALLIWITGLERIDAWIGFGVGGWITTLGSQVLLGVRHHH